MVRRRSVLIGMARLRIELRHKQFLHLIDGNRDASIMDLGCGFGDFFRFLRAEGHRGTFIGYDVAPGMIAKAIELHGEGTDRCWRVGARPADVADFAVASGLLNVKGDVPVEVWSRYVHAVIDTLARAGRRGFRLQCAEPFRRSEIEAGGPLLCRPGGDAGPVPCPFWAVSRAPARLRAL